MANHLKMATIDSILLLHERGWSSRRIARHLGIHRDTVARCLKQSKQARTPIGSAESKLGQAPIGSEDFKLGQALIGSEGTGTPSLTPVSAVSDNAPRRPQPSLCEPFRIHFRQAGTGPTAQRIAKTWRRAPLTGKYHSVRRLFAGFRNPSAVAFSPAEVVPEKKPRSTSGTVFCIQQLTAARRSHVFASS